MSGFDWKGAIGTFAPKLAGLLGTPVAGIAVAGLCNILGLEPSPENAQKAAEQIAAGQLTGDQLIALKKLEADSVAQLQKMGLDYDLQTEQLVATDRASARQREMTVKDWTPKILAYGVTAGFFGLLAFMLKHEIPNSSKDVLNLMLGSLGTAWISIIAYYFGSSHTDADTKTMLYNSTPGVQK